MNQKFISIIIGSGIMAATLGTVMYMEYRTANNNIVTDKFPTISSTLQDTQQISSLLSGLDRNGDLPVSVSSGNQGKDNPFERY